MAIRALKLARADGRRAEVLKLALPAVGEQFLNLLVGLVDTFLVGHLAASTVARLGYGSAEALAAVGMSNYVVWTITTLFIAVSVGATALVARAAGAADRAEANLALRQSLVLGAAMGLLAGALVFAFAPQMLRVYGAPAEVVPLGVAFLRIAALAMLPAALLFVGNAALRGAGDTRTPLLVMLVVNTINVLVAWSLVDGRWGLPTLGVQGTALGAALGRGTGGILVVALLVRGKGLLKLDRLPRPDWSMLARLVRVGLPAGAEQIVFQAALVPFARSIAGLGTIAFAAHNTVLQIESISFLPGLGFAAAATTLVGQGLGAQDVERARWSSNEAFRQAVTFMGVMGLLFLLIPGVFLRMMVGDPEVIRAGMNPLRTVGLVQPMLAASFVYSGALRGAGDTRFPLWIKLISPWCVRLPLVYVLAPWLGLLGAWIALSSDLAVQGLLAWRRFHGNRWERILV